MSQQKGGAGVLFYDLRQHGRGVVAIIPGMQQHRQTVPVGIFPDGLIGRVRQRNLPVRGQQFESDVETATEERIELRLDFVAEPRIECQIAVKALRIPGKQLLSGQIAFQSVAEQGPFAAQKQLRHAETVHLREQHLGAAFPQNPSPGMRPVVTVRVDDPHAVRSLAGAEFPPQRLPVENGRNRSGLSGRRFQIQQSLDIAVSNQFTLRRTDPGMRQHGNCGAVMRLAADAEQNALRPEFALQQFDGIPHMQPGNIHENIRTAPHGIEHGTESRPHLLGQREIHRRKFPRQIFQIAQIILLGECPAIPEQQRFEFGEFGQHPLDLPDRKTGNIRNHTQRPDPARGQIFAQESDDAALIITGRSNHERRQQTIRQSGGIDFPQQPPVAECRIQVARLDMPDQRTVDAEIVEMPDESAGIGEFRRFISPAPDCAVDIEQW
ncbi:hypothetical protein SDC9_117736 [bioreactor metagenome]|uniref:Uncharacterized protein n=1 Tax=bioreactor metagenome TaxID=1076179 RepID=A0A645BZ03_9ZZZZ